MRSLIIIIFFIFLIPFLLFAHDSVYVFVIDENLNPLQGYKILETRRDDVYISKIEPIKKWIISVKSQLIVVKDGYFYPVKDSIIVDKRQGLALLLIDFSGIKPLYFNPEDFPIDRDVKLLPKDKKLLISKVDILFPSEIKIQIKPGEADFISLAKYYENTGQWEKAVAVYGELLKQEPKNKEILEKIGILYYKTGNFKKAIEYFLKLPKNEDVLTKIAGIYIIEKDFEKALEILNSSDIIESAYIHYLKGIVYYLSGKKDEAYKEVTILSKINKNLSQNLRELLR